MLHCEVVVQYGFDGRSGSGDHWFACERGSEVPRAAIHTYLRKEKISILPTFFITYVENPIFSHR